MGVLQKMTLACMALSLGGCSSTENLPPAQTVLPSDLAERVDRMRGCWIARNGSGATFLRLLPPTFGDTMIRGSVHVANSTDVDHVAALSFSRDGSSATLAGRDAVPETFTYVTPAWAPVGGNWMTYRTQTTPVLFLVVEAPGDTLRIMTTLGPTPGPMALSPVYEGNRDGCD